MNQILKKCTKCRKTKTLDSFGKRKEGKDGLNSRCKPCRVELSLANKRRNQHKPCTSCGHPEREIGSSLCKPCKQKGREVSISNNSHKPCTSCGHPERATGQPVCRVCSGIKSAMSKYNITEDEVIALRAKNHCDACGRSKEEAATEKAFHIDHCHDKGHVRGVLCHYCNTALGMMLDDPVRILKLGMYLNRANYDEANTGNHGR